MIFGKHQRDIRLQGRMTPDQSMAADFLGQPHHAEGFLGRYIFSGIPWYADVRGRFSTVLFLQLRSWELTWKRKTETNDSEEMSH